MRINYTKYNMLLHATDLGDEITLSFRHPVINKAIKWNVNWAAIGSQTPEKTVAYAEKLIRAAIIAENLNSMKITINWDEDEKIKKMFETDSEKASIWYKNEIDKLGEAVRNDEWNYVAEFIKEEE